MAADRVRDEAERLVAAALAAVSSATRGLGGPGNAFATGSAECCVCPVCRAIAAMRDPGSDLAERLAAGVGDLASGVTAILRTLSSRGARSQAAAEEPAAAEGDEFWEDLRRRATDAAKAYTRPGTESSTVDDPWRAATREPASDPDVKVPTPAPETLVPRPTVAKKTAKKATAPKAVAKKAVRKAPAPGASQQGARDSREREERGTSPAIASNGRTARTGRAGTTGAVAKKAVKKVAPPEGAA